MIRKKVICHGVVRYGVHGDDFVAYDGAVRMMLGMPGDRYTILVPLQHPVLG